MSEIKNQAEQIASETHYEDLACEILKDVEFKDESAIARAVTQIANYLRKNQFPQEVSDEAEGELKPCPFCGSKELALTSTPSRDGTVVFYTIHHLANIPCGIELMTTNRKSLITQWNNRSHLTGKS